MLDFQDIKYLGVGFCILIIPITIGFMVLDKYPLMFLGMNVYFVTTPMMGGLLGMFVYFIMVTPQPLREEKI